jgi:hypothetical protein
MGPSFPLVVLADGRGGWGAIGRLIGAGMLGRRPRMVVEGSYSDPGAVVVRRLWPVHGGEDPGLPSQIWLVCLGAAHWLPSEAVS